MDSLDRIYEIVKLAASRVIETRPDMDFTLGLAIRLAVSVAG